MLTIRIMLSTGRIKRVIDIRKNKVKPVKTGVLPAGSVALLVVKRRRILVSLPRLWCQWHQLSAYTGRLHRQTIWAVKTTDPLVEIHHNWLHTKQAYISHAFELANMKSSDLRALDLYHSDRYRWPDVDVDADRNLHAFNLPTVVPTAITEADDYSSVWRERAKFCQCTGLCDWPAYENRLK